MRFSRVKISTILGVFIFGIGWSAISQAQELKKAELRTFAKEFVRSQNHAKVSFENHKVEPSYFFEKLPVIYEPANLEKAKALYINQLWAGGIAGLSLSGDGQTVGYWDRNQPRLTHQEFGTRVTFEDVEAGSNDGHATQMVGTILANGTDSLARGIANKAEVEAYNWKNDIAEMAQAAANELTISAHPYSESAGWSSTSTVCGNDPIWTWYSLESENSTKAYQFGYYDSQAQLWDSVAYMAPNYLIVKAAGNVRGKGPVSQPVKHWKVDNSLNCYQDSTSVREINGGLNGYESLNGASVSKNVLVVGSVESSSESFENVNTISAKDYSGFGPTDDGRIKPDIVAPTDFFTTSSASDASYSNSEGTSASSAFVAGSVALLREHYQNLFTDTLSSASIRALLAHTAEDLGNIGPDYKTGWGLIKPERAARFISSTKVNPNISLLKDTVLTNGGSIQFNYTNNSSTPLKLTIAWTDPKGSIPISGDDPTNKILVNDIDARLQSPSAETHLPWKLSRNNPENDAIKADNEVDNIEQVFIESPEIGVYSVQISHKGSLEGGSQKVSIMLSSTEPKVEIATISNGDWNSISTWENDKIPSSSFDKAVIKHAVEVQENTLIPDIEFNGSSASVKLNSKKIEIRGAVVGDANNGFIGDSLAQLVLSGKAKSNLWLKSGYEKLQSFTFDVGTDTLQLETDITIFEELFAKSGFLKTQENVLTLISDSTKSALFVKNEGEIIGDVTYERKFSSPISGWRMISSPFTQEKYNALNATFFTQGGNWATHSADSIQASLWEFNNSEQKFTSIVGENASFVNGSGYLLYMFSKDENGSGILPAMMRMKGIEADSLTIDLHRGDADSSSYNFVGNPFLGTIDWHEIVNDGSNIGSSYATWNPDTSSSNFGYVYYNSASEIGEAGRYIAPMQGFFVQSTANNSKIVFNQSQKTKSNTKLYGKKNEQADKSIINIRLKNEAGKLLDSQARLFFNENTNTGRDEFDVMRLPLLHGKENSISFKNQEKRKLVFEGRSMHLAADSIKVLMEVSSIGGYKIDWNLISIPKDWKVELIDASSTNRIDLREVEFLSLDVGDESELTKSFGLVINRSLLSSGEKVDEDVPGKFSLSQNYPNPFNPQTVVEYAVPFQTKVRIDVFDVLGRNVATLIDEVKSAGKYSVLFNATNIASGTYFYRITAGDFIQINKMAVIK